MKRFDECCEVKQEGSSLFVVDKATGVKVFRVSLKYARKGEYGLVVGPPKSGSYKECDCKTVDYDY